MGARGLPRWALAAYLPTSLLRFCPTSNGLLVSSEIWGSHLDLASITLEGRTSKAAWRRDRALGALLDAIPAA